MSMKHLNKALLLVAAFTLLSLGTFAGGRTEEAVGPTGTTMAPTKFSEAPMLAAKVAAGELPPVDKRLPDEPAILKTGTEIGKYGGTLQVHSTSPNPWNDLTTEVGCTLLRVAVDGSFVEGNIAKDYEISDDGRKYTFYLREGLKWSDGEPFTADDIIYQFEDVLWQEDVAGWNRVPLFNKIFKVDDYTVRFEADEAYYTAVLLFAPAEGIGWRFFKPKHYFKKWHIRYNEDANDLAKEEGFETWIEGINDHQNWAPQKDLDIPSVYPWKIIESTTTQRSYTRNPYYWKVDNEGNQLPYVDGVVTQLVEPELYHLKIINGESDVAFTRTEFSNWPLYKRNETAGDYRIIQLEAPVITELDFNLNFNDPDPVLAKIYQDKRFRRALSLAINREEINDVLYFGLGVPRAAAPLPNSSYYKEAWGKAYADYDPNRAGRFLDEMGLDKKDADGFRLRSDGETLMLIIEHGAQDDVIVSHIEMVTDYWKDVGVKTLIKFTSDATRWRSDDHGMRVTDFDDMNEPSVWSYGINQKMARGGTTFKSYAWNWGLWMNAEEEIRLGRTTLADYEGGVMPGEEPPQYVKDYNAVVDSWRSVPYGSKEYVEIAEKIFDFQAENVFHIGTVGMAPLLYIAKNNVGNVPEKAWANFSWRGSPNMGVDMLFFKDL
jgi:peptide/nickel transport system substrate-binding protein